MSTPSPDQIKAFLLDLLSEDSAESGFVTPPSEGGGDRGPFLDIHIADNNPWEDPAYILDKDGRVDAEALGTERGGKNGEYVRIPNFAKGTGLDKREDREYTYVANALKGRIDQLRVRLQKSREYGDKQKLHVDFAPLKGGPLDGFVPSITTGFGSTASDHLLSKLDAFAAKSRGKNPARDVTLSFRNGPKPKVVFLDLYVDGDAVIVEGSTKGASQKLIVRLLKAYGQTEDAAYYAENGMTVPLGQKSDGAKSGPAQETQRQQAPAQQAPPPQPNPVESFAPPETDFAYENEPTFDGEYM